MKDIADGSKDRQAALQECVRNMQAIFRETWNKKE